MVVSKSDEENDVLIEEKEKNFSNYAAINSDEVVNGVVQRCRSFDFANRVVLSWHDINVFVRPSSKPFFRKPNEDDLNSRKQLLIEVSGEVKPGQLLAIMGASGAGKTTLLNVLTNRNLGRLLVEGEVLVNGDNVGSNISRLSAYVQQDDLFIGTLTVREHLIFQAILKMAKTLTYEERMRRVDDVILEMGLTKCADTVIGIAGRVKGISGGETKRLSFAAEVLTNPALLFCDEPTSGLDSFMSESIVSVLRDMAEGGRTIICTIHQPSSEAYAMFDHLLLMAEGRVAYMGPSSKALEFFERVDLCCPVNYNPADFFIHNLAIIPGREEECKERINAICAEFMRESVKVEFHSRSLESSFPIHQVSERSKYRAGWWTQFNAVLWRSWISLLREPTLTKIRLVQSVIISLLLGLIYLNQKYDQQGIMNMNGALFLMITNISLTYVYAVINVFCLEQAIFFREHWNGMYRVDVYFICKMLTETPILTLMAVIYTSILYWMVGFNSDIKTFFFCLAIILLVANTAASFGYMISTLTSSVQVAASITSPVLMPLLLFGGFYLNNLSVPVYFVWIKYLSWFYYGNEALVINQWSSVTNISCPTIFCMKDGKAVIKMLNFDENNFYKDIGLLVVLMIGYRLVAFLILLVKSTRRT